MRTSKQQTITSITVLTQHPLCRRLSLAPKKMTLLSFQQTRFVLKPLNSLDKGIQLFAGDCNESSLVVFSTPLHAGPVAPDLCLTFGDANDQRLFKLWLVSGHAEIWESLVVYLWAMESWQEIWQFVFSTLMCFQVSCAAAFTRHVTAMLWRFSPASLLNCNYL